MMPAGALAPQPWMTAPATRAVVAALTAEGAEIRFVGGCVRDTVIGRAIKDIDIATHDPPETVMALLASAGITAIPTGLSHGTVTAVVEAAHFEITTLRRDVETDGRRAKIAFTRDWAADAARRDLTINAIFLAPDGTLYDPFGGLEDLRAGRIRFVGDARARISEDVLRLLRFFRFFAHYGRPPPDPAALAACRELAPRLPQLSGERVAGEMLKLLAAPEPASIVALMREEGILRYVLPEAAGVAVLRALVTVEGLGPGCDPLRRLAALIDPVGGAAAAEAVADRLRLSNAERERLAAFVAPPLTARAEMTAHERRVALHRFGGALFRDLVLMSWARTIAAAGPGARYEVEAWRDLLAAAAAWRPISLPVKGADVLALDVAPGPEVGRLLAAVESWWIAEDFVPDREACLRKLASLIEGRR
ncbi:MAG TPA: CCA tRNA nucleotidyltransferase [Alphaproteobacteria bacterium]|nr:CCA tRNA nucleotidyltransferase [Alphaproteobacteria bacterium]